MAPAEIRKLTTIVEETRREMGEWIEPQTRKAAAIAVIRKPFAGLSLASAASKRKS